MWEWYCLNSSTIYIFNPIVTRLLLLASIRPNCSTEPVLIFSFTLVDAYNGSPNSSVHTDRPYPSISIDEGN